MNTYPSAIYPIAYNSTHEPESRALVPKPTYKFIVRSSRNDNYTLNDWFEPLHFKIHFDDSMPMQNDADYQIALETFEIYHIDTANHNRPIMLNAIGNRATNVSDCYTSYAGTATATAAGRSDVLAIVHTNGVHNSITPDTIGVPCAGLNIFASRGITLQLRHMYGDALVDGDVGSRASHKYGDWVAMFVLYPKIK